MSPDIYILKLDDEQYANANLQQRLLSDMIAHEAETKFHSTCSHMITDRCHEKYKGKGYKEWDRNETLSIEEHNKEMEINISCYFALKRVYESVFGSVEPYKELINKIAKEYAESMLKAYGWRKEN